MKNFALAAIVLASSLAFANSPSDTSKANETTWTLIGSLEYGASYHQVVRAKNKDSLQVIDGDTIKVGEHFRNVFQVPGLAIDANIFLLLQSSDGKSLELNTNITADAWNPFSPNPFTLNYSDNYNNLTLGDSYKSGGAIFLEGMPLFGIDYTLSFLKHKYGFNILHINGFFGEVVRPLLPGDKHPYIYNSYIENGTAEAQRIATGGSIKATPSESFGIELGALYAFDEIEDPILRDGNSQNVISLNPLQESMTLFAAAEFSPHRTLQFNAEFAIGSADTADVYRERALNEVFAKAGVDGSSFELLRRLMQNESAINRLTDSELEEIFGDNTVLTRSEKRDSIKVLIREAKALQKATEKTRDEDRVMGLDFKSKNIAFKAGVEWNYKETEFEAYFKHFGESYFSEGSHDGLQDAEELGARLRQGILDHWDLDLKYTLLAENLDNGREPDFNKFGEKFTHRVKLDNGFKINDKVKFSLGYDFEYKREFRNTKLHGNYLLEDGVFNDRYFAAQKNRATFAIETETDTILVDSLRWNKYLDLADRAFLASEFEEKIFKHTGAANISFKALASSWSFGGRFTWREDASTFNNDALIRDFDFSNATWGKLGYHYGASNYYEHAYPVSISTSTERVDNYICFTPRFKTYNRDEMAEVEYYAFEEFEVNIVKRFLYLGLNGEFRYMKTEWTEHENDTAEDFDETEMDILGSLSLKMNFMQHFSAKIFGGAALYFRPDNLSNEYKDIFGGFHLNYEF